MGITNKLIINFCKELKQVVFLCFIYFSAVVGYSQTVVTSDTELQNLVNSASPGDVFVIPNGTYSDFYSSFTATPNGAPITVRAETVGGVTLTGDSHFVFKKASNIILEGFVFDCTGNNTMVKLEASNNIRITRNVFELDSGVTSVKWIVVTGYYNDYTFQFLSHNNRIDHNTFQNKTTEGNYITIDGTYNEDYTVTQQSQYDIIDHNYFFNNGPRIENGKEAIRIGNSLLSTTSGFTTVEYNLFEDCDGDPEIVSVKSCDNIIRRNTFLTSYGTLTLRQGNRNWVEGNYFFGGDKANGMFETQTIYTGGIRAYGTDHVIVNNYLEGLKGTRFDAPITLTQGDAIDGIDTNYSLHFRGERIVIAYNTLVNNTHNIEIGYAKQDGSYDESLKDITIANNLVTGSQNSMIKIYNDQSGEITWSNNLMFPTESAVINSDGYSFNSSELFVQDTELSVQDNIYKSTSNTPLITNSVAELNIEEDIEGQERPSSSNPGSDHFSSGTVVYSPTTIDDVGPNAYEETLSIQPNEADKIIIFPNPVEDTLFIKTQQEPIVEINVIDVFGKQVLNKKDSNNLDVSTLNTGFYTVLVKTNFGTSSHKIIIK